MLNDLPKAAVALMRGPTIALLLTFLVSVSFCGAASQAELELTIGIWDLRAGEPRPDKFSSDSPSGKISPVRLVEIIVDRLELDLVVLDGSFPNSERWLTIKSEFRSRGFKLALGPLPVQMAVIAYREEKLQEVDSFNQHYGLNVAQDGCRTQWQWPPLYASFRAGAVEFTLIVPRLHSDRDKTLGSCDSPQFNEWARQQQVQRILDEISMGLRRPTWSRVRRRIIIAGNFNSEAGARPLAILHEAGFHLLTASGRIGADSANSTRARAFNHILVSEGLREAVIPQSTSYLWRWPPNSEDAAPIVEFGRHPPVWTKLRLTQ